VNLAGAAAGMGTMGRIEVFEYPVYSNGSADASGMPAWEEFGAGENATASGNPAQEEGGDRLMAVRSAEFDARLAEDTRRSFEAGRERGRQEGSQAEREAQAAATAAAEQRRIQQAAALIESFSEERDRYLQAVEREVVELALAIAARILRREAQMDPLLLTGAVRVALGQLSASTEVQLLVPPAELDLWTDAIAALPRLSVKPTVTAGEGMRLGDCVVETALGSVDLGIRSQLGEIERGFFDRAGSTSPEPADEAQSAAEAVRG